METILENGVAYPLLKADKKGYVKCPFCSQKHKHGKVSDIGHRSADCGSADFIDSFVTKDGRCEKTRGYFVQFV